MGEFSFTDAHMRAAAKAARDGVEALTPDERELYEETAQLARRSCGRITPEQSEIMQRGMEAYDRLPWADRLRYEQWTPPHSSGAFLPLIEEHEGPDL